MLSPAYVNLDDMAAQLGSNEKTEQINAKLFFEDANDEK